MFLSACVGKKYLLFLFQLLCQSNQAGWLGILFCMPHLFHKSVAIGAIILFELSICLRRHVCEYPTAIGLCYRYTKKFLK